VTRASQNVGLYAELIGHRAKGLAAEGKWLVDGQPLRTLEIIGMRNWFHVTASVTAALTEDTEDDHHRPASENRHPDVHVSN
jgi:hypothetical protein